MDMFLKNNIISTTNPLGYELIADTLVSSATTTVSFTGLNITKDDNYLLIADIYNPTGSTTRISPFFNGNTTTTNYWQQYLSANGTTLASGRENISNLAYLDTTRKSFFSVPIKLTNDGYIAWEVNCAQNYSLASAIQHIKNYCTSTFTATSITSIAFTASITNSIGIGSRFQLYKLFAEKIADITVSGSATSAIDITGLNITTDSQYMLVSSLYNSSATDTAILIYVNGNNTATNYYTQDLQASASTASGARTNVSKFSGCSTGRRTYSIAHFWLTESGRFVCQGESIRNLDNTLLLLDRYVASTFTMSSITSISVRSDVTNALGIGTRIQLYKLK